MPMWYWRRFVLLCLILHNFTTAFPGTDACLCMNITSWHKIICRAKMSRQNRIMVIGYDLLVKKSFLGKAFLKHQPSWLWETLGTVSDVLTYSLMIIHESRYYDLPICSVNISHLSIFVPSGFLFTCFSQVRVIITDENDCVPEFLQSIYSKDGVPETVTTATSLLQGKSVDLHINVL